MVEEIKSLTPEMFWELYSKKLNEAGTCQAYQHSSKWSPVVIEMAKKVIVDMLSDIPDEGDCKLIQNILG